MVEGVRLDAMLRTHATIGTEATGVIRIERVGIADAPGPNRIPMTLKTQMYLGERWEMVLCARRAHGARLRRAPLAEGEHQVEFPAQALWVF